MMVITWLISNHLYFSSFPSSKYSSNVMDRSKDCECNNTSVMKIKKIPIPWKDTSVELETWKFHLRFIFKFIPVRVCDEVNFFRSLNGKWYFGKSADEVVPSIRSHRSGRRKWRACTDLRVSVKAERGEYSDMILLQTHKVGGPHLELQTPLQGFLLAFYSFLFHASVVPALPTVLEICLLSVRQSHPCIAAESGSWL